MISLLEACGRHGKWVLPLGLIAGVSLPWAADPVRHLIPWCIALLLFLSVLRLLYAAPAQPSPVAVTGSFLSTLALIAQPGLWITVLSAQLLLPVVLYYGALPLGLGAPWLLALMLVASASPISGSPNLVQMLGGDDALALRWLILGTALLPLTCLPVMYLSFPSHSALLLLYPSLKLLVLISAAVLAAWATAKLCQRARVSLSHQALDGAASLTLALMVIGLMSAFHDPGNNGRTVLLTLGVAIGINFGLQILGVLAGLAIKRSTPHRVTLGVVFGNRNIALYLAALPPMLTEPLLLFIACYQIPMYLTPLLGSWFYQRVGV